MTKPSASLRERCLAEAKAIVADNGVEALSMREVARRLKVSHQAPYKHFASRDHILAEIVGRAFDDFAEHLERRSRATGVEDEMMAMGLAYFEYALSRPLEYRLMFSTPLPDPRVHPDMLERAGRCFELLEESLGKLAYARRADVDGTILQRDALFIWAVIHGLSTAMKSDAIGVMPLSDDTLRTAMPHILARIGTVLRGPVPRAEEIAHKGRVISESFPDLMRRIPRQARTAPPAGEDAER